MVSGISSSSSYYTSALQTQSRGRPNPAEMFAKIDSDSSGGISETELTSFTSNMKTQSSSESSESSFSTYDKDGNGELDASEMQAYMQAMSPPPPPMGGGMRGASPEETFAAADEDDSSTLSADELATFASNFTSATGGSLDIDDAISTYDTDGDGELNASEMDEFMKASGAPGVKTASASTRAESLLSQYDEDSDGLLNSTELESLLSSTSQQNSSLIQSMLSAYSQNSGTASQDLVSLLFGANSSTYSATI